MMRDAAPPLVERPDLEDVVEEEDVFARSLQVGLSRGLYSLPAAWFRYITIVRVLE